MKTSKQFWRFLYVITLSIICVFCTVSINVEAEEANVNVATIIKLQKFLTGQTELSQEDAKTCDMNNDEKLNVYDFCMLKQLLLYKTEEVTEEFANAFEQMTIKDEIVPVLNDENVVEIKNNIFSFKYNGKNYCYTLLSQTNQTASYLLMNPADISGIHVWEYTGNEEVGDVNEQVLPDTTNVTFDYQGKTHEYALIEYAEINATAVSTVYNIIEGTKSMGATGYMYIARYDYNLNQELDTEDLTIMLKMYTSEPNNTKITVSAWYFYTFFMNLDNINAEKNFVINYSNEIVEFSYIIPHQTFVNVTDSIVLVHPLQVLSKEYYHQMLEEFGEPSENIQEYDYILYNSEYYFENYSEGRWLPVLTSNEEFATAGFYVQFLQESGEYVEDWIK